MKDEKVEKDPLLDMLEAQNHLATIFSNVSNIMLDLRNELASVKRERNELLAENGSLKERVARLEKCLEDRGGPSAEIIAARGDTPQKTGSKDQQKYESEHKSQNISPSRRGNETAQNEDSRKDQGNLNDPVPSSKETEKDAVVGVEKSRIADDDTQISKQNRVPGPVDAPPSEDLYTSSEDEAEDMEVDRDPVGKRKKFTADDSNKDEIIVDKANLLASILDSDDEGAEDEMAKLRGHEYGSVEVKKEVQDESLADKDSGLPKPAANTDVNNLVKISFVKSELTDDEDQDDDEQSGVNSIARTFASDMDRVFVNNFIKSNVEKKDGKDYCKPCGKSIYRRRDHVREDHLRPGSIYRCPKCEITRRNKHNFITHVYNKHPELRGEDVEKCMRYPCPICKRNFQSKEDRKYHVSRRHPHLMGGRSTSESSSNLSGTNNASKGDKAANSETFPRSSTPKKGDKGQEEADHKRYKHCEEFPKCLATFSTEKGLNGHIAMAHGNSPLLGSLSQSRDVLDNEKAANKKTISSSSSTRQDLNMFCNEYVEKKEGKSKCKLCDISYTTRAGILIHVKTKHLYKGAKYKCQQCGKIMNSESYLRQHYHLKHQNHKVDVEQCRFLQEEA